MPETAIYPLQPGNDALMDAHEAAVYLRVNIQTLRRLARGREIPCFKVGGTWRFSRGQLDAWAQAQQAPPRQPTILLVDDDELVGRYLKRLLEDHGFDVVALSGGRSALEWLDSNAPQLLVVDLKMPGMNADEMLRQVRGKFEYLPVILVTGYPEGELMSQALQHSPFAVVPKPIKPEQLLEAVKWALGAEQLPPELR